MAFARLVVLFSLLLSAAALVVHHGGHYSHHRRAVSPRVPVPEPIVIPEQPAVNKRSLRKRCKVNPSTSSVSKPAHPQSALNHVTSSHSSSSVRHTPTTTLQQAHTKTSSAPQATGIVPYYLIGTQTGDGTFYATGLGSCGITNNDSQHICAVSWKLYDSFPGYLGGNPNNNPICGLKVTATYQGKSVELTITDRCTGCAETDLDMAPSAFQELADLSVGRIHGMTWVWNEPYPN